MRSRYRRHAEAKGLDRKEQKARVTLQPPRLSFFTARAAGLITPRRLTTTHLRLRVRPERAHHAVNAGPRAHQLGIVAEPIPHDAVQHLHLLGDLRHNGLEIGARTSSASASQLGTILKFPQTLHACKLLDHVFSDVWGALH